MNTENRNLWFAKRNATLIELRKQFPLAFPSTPQPLKVGIHQDIFDAHYDEIPARRWVRRALGYYVQSHAYLNSLTTGSDRINLQGVSEGQVSEQEAINAKKALDGRKKKNKPTKRKSNPLDATPITHDNMNKNLVVKKTLTLRKNPGPKQTD